MANSAELRREREFMAHVQQILYAVISRSKSHAEFQDETIKSMITDAWEELRMKPTALSPQDIDQLNIEIDRFLMRKSFSENNAARYERMLLSPFFARIDFKEAGFADFERIVIGLYSLKEADGALLVHDWRAPICSLYYNNTPGKVGYASPSGHIDGDMALKRQYKMEGGRLKYFVDTEHSIDDGMLLDILSRSTTDHMRQIVATIQVEQNAAIRREEAPILSVAGGAGSGKTSVALHRAAYLMYQQRDQLTADTIAVVSPGVAFTEYVSGVLPELGEQNVKSLTLHTLLSEIIGKPVESPVDQAECLLRGESPQRLAGVRVKSDQAFVAFLDEFAERYRLRGPVFGNLTMRKHLLASKRELERLYREQFKMLTPAQRLTRIQAIMDSRLADWERSLLPQYKDQFLESYRGKELDFISQMAVSQQLHPIRSQIKKMLLPNPLDIYAEAMVGLDRAQAVAAAENAEAGAVSWEDAPGIAYLLIKLGFLKADVSLRHLLVDEAQDYSDIALRLMKLYHPRAHVTLLGDPNQRTQPGFGPCDPEHWGALMEHREAPLIRLSRAYRSTMEITDFCNSLMESDSLPLPFGRHGEAPERVPYTKAALLGKLAEWKGEPGKRIAVIARTRDEARELKKTIKGAYLLAEADDAPDPSVAVTVSSYQLLKGMEYDAVAVVWPVPVEADDERRRLYTACSRALHKLALFEKG